MWLKSRAVRMVIRKRAAYTTTKRIMPALSRDFPERWSDSFADARSVPPTMQKMRAMVQGR